MTHHLRDLAVKVTLAVAVAAGLASAPAAKAEVITFLISGTVGDPASLPDVGTISGSFTYDNSDITLTNVAITTTAGPALGAGPPHCRVRSTGMCIFPILISSITVESSISPAMTEIFCCLFF